VFVDHQTEKNIAVSFAKRPVRARPRSPAIVVTPPAQNNSNAGQHKLRLSVTDVVARKHRVWRDPVFDRLSGQQSRRNPEQLSVAPSFDADRQSLHINVERLKKQWLGVKSSKIQPHGHPHWWVWWRRCWKQTKSIKRRQIASLERQSISSMLGDSGLYCST
jgi:hypothetical protein